MSVYIYIYVCVCTQETDKHPTAVGFQPFTSSHSGEEDEKMEVIVKLQNK